MKGRLTPDQEGPMTDVGAALAARDADVRVARYFDGLNREVRDMGIERCLLLDERALLRAALGDARLTLVKLNADGALSKQIDFIERLLSGAVRATP